MKLNNAAKLILNFCPLCEHCLQFTLYTNIYNGSFPKYEDDQLLENYVDITVIFMFIYFSTTSLLVRCENTPEEWLGQALLDGSIKSTHNWLVSFHTNGPILKISFQNRVHSYDSTNYVRVHSVHKTSTLKTQKSTNTYVWFPVLPSHHNAHYTFVKLRDPHTE